MTHAYKAHLIELGIYGNHFSADSNKLGFLATDKIWFKFLWGYLAYMGVKVVLDKIFLDPIHRGE